MTLASYRHSPVQRQLDAYRESWQADHESLKQCWAWEDTISVGIACGRLIEKTTLAWRERVFRGTEVYEADSNEFHRSIYELWLQVSDALIQHVNERFENTYAVEGVVELKALAVQLRASLQGWNPPRLSSAVGLREIELSKDAEENLTRILEEAKSDPPPSPTGPKMKQLSPAEFLALHQQS